MEHEKLLIGLVAFFGVSICAAGWVCCFWMIRFFNGVVEMMKYQFLAVSNLKEELELKNQFEMEKDIREKGHHSDDDEDSSDWWKG